MRHGDHVPVADRHSFAVARIGDVRVAIDASRLNSIETHRPGRRLVELLELLGLERGRASGEHVLVAGHSMGELAFRVDEIILCDVEIERLHAPPGLIRGRMKNRGVFALLDLEDNDWAIVLNLEAFARSDNRNMEVRP